MPLSPKELRTRRIAAGWSRQQLASKLGVSSDLLAAWEDGDIPIECHEALRAIFARAEMAPQKPDGNAC